MKQGWEIKKLGEVCDIQGGSTPKRTESMFWEDGTFPWFTIEDIREQGRIITDTKQKITKVAWDKMRIFPKDTILLCCTASLGEYAITKIPLSSNQQFNGLMIKDKDYLSPMYLMHYCATLKNTLLSLSGKATIDFVSAEKVRQIPMPIPPIEEQERIVAELDCLCGIIEKKREQLKKLDALAESIFYTMFGDPITNEKGWEVKKLSDAVSDDCPISYGIVQPMEDVEGGIPIVRPIDLVDTFARKDNLKRTSTEISNAYKRTILRGDEILMCVRGTTGVVSMASDELKGCNTTRGIVPLFFDSINRWFVYYLIKQQSMQCLIADNTYGIALKQINIKELRLLPIIAPPLTFQQEFADKIEAIEKQKELIKKSISETETLFNARMDYYFN